MTLLVVLPILIPLVNAAISLALGRRIAPQRGLAAAGTGAMLIVSLLLLANVWNHGIQVVQMGGWPAPYGITLAVDLLGAIMLVMGSLMGFCVALYALGDIDAPRERYGYHALFHVLLMGVSGAFLTGDIFNLYVWFEVLLMASFTLLALGGERAQLEGAIKYVALNFIASALFLAGVGILYGIAGTLNMADLATFTRTSPHGGLLNVVSVLFLIAFGIKAAMFPLFFWLPASYHTPPAAVSAIFSGLLTKVGVYALLRVFTLIFPPDVVSIHGIILVGAGLSMVTGVLGAAAQFEFRRILSFHIVSQIGYLVMGLGLFTPLAAAGSVFFMVHNIIAKANLFLISGIVHRLQGSYQLKELGGLYHARPFLSGLFLVTAMSLAGLPPLSGFFGKLILIVAGLRLQSWLIVAVALMVGLLTLFSMTKIWAYAFWKPAPAEETPPPAADGRDLPRVPLGMMAPVVLLAFLTVAIGLAAGPMFALAEAAGRQLLDTQGYIRAVLGPEM